MKVTETKTISLPIEVPDISKLEDLDALLESKKTQLRELKDTLKMFIWCTEPAKIKPTDMDVFRWIDNNIDNLIERQNNIGTLEVQIYILELWKKNWNSTTKVTGFASQETSSQGTSLFNPAISKSIINESTDSEKKTTRKTRKTTK